jgi:5S rRNA maturation endonuclease (ribonuclease M5)
MNAKQAKSIDFPALMSRLGYTPVKSNKGGRELWYSSPFRNEKTPSFHTSFLGGKWIWNDFGDTGGNVIDFVMRHEGLNSIKDALAFLRGIYQSNIIENPTQISSNSFSFQQQAENINSITAAEKQLQFIEDLPLESEVLLSYLEKSRKINRELSQKYLKLIRYKNLKNNKCYFGFGMMNRAGGFEVRSGSDEYSFKTALIARDISIIEGEKNTKETLVFEGMVDALAFLQMTDLLTPPYCIIIMHSVNSYKKCSDFIKSQDFQRIFTFLDNDDAGIKCEKRYKKDHGEKIISQRLKYAPYKDVNEALIAGETIRFFDDNLESKLRKTLSL